MPRDTGSLAAPRPPVPVGPRIVIYGPSGSGKTTLSRALGEKLGLPAVELDAVFHAHPNWVDLSREEFRERVSALLADLGGGWAMDGNYGHVRDLLLTRADTVIWLRLPFRTVYWRLARRTLTRAARHQHLWNGNYESWRQLVTADSMLWWGIKSWRTNVAKTKLALATTAHHARVFVLRNPRQVRALVERAVLSVPADAAAPEAGSSHAAS